MALNLKAVLLRTPGPSEEPLPLICSLKTGKENTKAALNPEVGSSAEEIIFHRGLPEWFLFLFSAKSDPRTMGPIQSVFKAVNATTRVTRLPE